MNMLLNCFVPSCVTVAKMVVNVFMRPDLVQRCCPKPVVEPRINLQPSATCRAGAFADGVSLTRHWAWQAGAEHVSVRCAPLTKQARSRPLLGEAELLQLYTHPEFDIKQKCAGFRV